MLISIKTITTYSSSQKTHRRRRADTPGAPPTTTARGSVDKQGPRDFRLAGSDVRHINKHGGTDEGKGKDGERDSEQGKPHIIRQPRVEGSAKDLVSPPFDDIRRFCEGSLPSNRLVDTRPQAVAEHRRTHWPDMIGPPGKEGLIKIYRAVRDTGLPNAMAARIPLSTGLKVEAWDFYLGRLGDRHRVLDFIKFGFATGYIGPVSDTVGTPNHPSATEYPAQVRDFIEKERRSNGIIGPCDAPPFSPWCHASPLMTREKSDPAKRRVITDMTFPREHSINAFVVKNGVYGVEHVHSLPTVDALAGEVARAGPDALLATLDVSRAYKNFASDPLDWPLLCFEWENKYFCDLSMPFGARASSYHMQSVANCITDILKAEGITCYMYLDDLVILSTNREVAERHYTRAKELFAELGLPEAEEKAQPPAPVVKWLGIRIDAKNKTLSIPAGKIHDVVTQVGNTIHKQSITKRKLQSLLGHLIFIAKCVRPARIFISRLLNALRKDPQATLIQIDEEMRKDLEWFLAFAGQWNGVALMTPASPSKVVLVDACLTGIGATDGKWAYGQQLFEYADGGFNITELEAMNIVVALHSLITEEDRGTHIRVRCDNMAAVEAMVHARARNPVLQECARAAWMVEAALDIKLSYDHIPGVDNCVADALSRAHLGASSRARAESLVAYYGLACRAPCMYFMDNPDILYCYRSSSTPSDGESSCQADHSKGKRDTGQPRVRSVGVHRVHVQDESGPTCSDISDGVRIPGIRGGTHAGSIHHQEQTFTHENVLPPDWGPYGDRWNIHG